MKYVFILTAILFSLSAHAQDQSNQFGSINLATPNAASLGKFIDQPVNLHTGIPEISIPIYTISEGPLSFPVSLSYHAGGVKVQDMASWVGLNWALRSSGLITRTVRGLPDEKISPSEHVSYYGNNGYFKYLFNVQNNLDYSKFVTGEKDGEPDLFFFNFNGYSGRFVIREDNTPVIIPHQNIRIEPVFCSAGEACNTNVELLRSWKITTPDGVKYYFGISLDNIYGDPAMEKIHPYTEKNGLNISPVISSWYLYKIESPDAKFQIRFEYQKEEYSYYSLSLGNYLTNITYEDKLLAKNTVSGVRLKKISFSQGSVLFEPEDEPRQDLGGLFGGLLQGVNTQAKALKRIVIKSNGAFCKQVDFGYSYFYSNNVPLQGVLAGYESMYYMTIHKKRLKLTSIQERSCNAGVIIPKTEFTYDEDMSLPSIFSFGVDHWGYYNGKDLNPSMIPNLSTDGGSTYALIGGNRESSWPDMRAGALISIKHQTGGYTNYVYGYDQMSNIPPGGGPPVNNLIGGLRIDQVIKYDNNGEKLLETHYDYPAGVTLFSIPAYIFKIRNPVLRIGDDGNNIVVPQGCISFAAGNPPFHFVASSASIHPLKTTTGNHKGYEQVKVTLADGGYSLYNYDVINAPDVTKGVSVRAINKNECTGFEPQFPPVPENEPLRRGTLLHEQHFSSGGAIPVKEIIYQPTYQDDKIGVHGIKIAPTPRGTPAPTEYQVVSGRKTSEIKIEKTYDVATGERNESKTETRYGSQFHTFPTSTVLYENALVNAPVYKEKKVSYAKDFSPCNNVVYGYLQNASEALTMYQFNLERCRTSEGRATICNELQGCSGRPRNPCTSQDACNFCAFTDYQTKLNNIRKAYVNNLIEGQEIRCLNDLAAVSDPVYQAILDLNKQNNVSAQIELSEWKGEKLVNSSWIEYANYDNSLSPARIFKTEMNNPIPAFGFSAAHIANNSFVADNAYSPEAETTLTYENGNLVEGESKNGVVISYLWDSGKPQVIVKAEGATYQELKAAFVSAQSGAQVGTPLFNQQLRFLLSNALVTTYSHEDLSGIKSVTDANNLTVHYEYDGLGRLKLIKDNDGNIIKRYDYQFKMAD